MQQLTSAILAQQAEKEMPFVPDALQCGLTQEFLAPARAALEEDLLRLRADFDQMFLARNPGRAQQYPIGFCREITAGVLKLLSAELNACARPGTVYPGGVAALHGFCSAGGRVKLIWGDLRHCYFQNAMQLGDWYVDVANDSVVRTKPKVEILPMERAEFYALKNYEAYARVAESYWRVRVFPNLYLPWMAPLYPLLLVYPNGSIRLHSPYQTLFYLNLHSHFGLAEQFIWRSDWSSNRLLEADLVRLAHQMRHSGDSAFQLPAVPNESDALLHIFKDARATQLCFDAGRCQQLINQALRFNAQEKGIQEALLS